MDAGGGTEARLAAMKERARLLEAALGKNHPQVGKAWLYLSRAYQTEGPTLYAAQAEQALIRHSNLMRIPFALAVWFEIVSKTISCRAWQICSQCFSNCSTSANQQFDSLLTHIRSVRVAPVGDAGVPRVAPPHE